MLQVPRRNFLHLIFPLFEVASLIATHKNANMHTQSVNHFVRNSECSPFFLHSEQCNDAIGSANGAAEGAGGRGAGAEHGDAHGAKT